MLTRARATWDDLGRDVQLLLISAGLMGLTFFGIFGTLFNLYLLRLGHDAAFVGWVGSLSCLAQAAVSVPASELGRKIGAKRAMVVGLTTMLVGMVGVALSERIPAGLQPTWIVARYWSSSPALASA
jgi:MFS family permease